MSKYTLIIGNKNYSSWSLRPWLAMKQFEVEFKEIRIPLYTPDSHALIQRYSPSGKVPVLLDGTVTIWESLAILEYLAEKFPEQHWWPAEPTAKVLARSISSEMHAGFISLRTQMPMNCRATLLGKEMTPAVQNDIERIKTIWRDCRQQFDQDGEWLFGSFTIADAMFAPIVLRFRTYDIVLDHVCKAYADSLLALRAMELWLHSAQTEFEVLPQFER